MNFLWFEISRWLKYFPAFLIASVFMDQYILTPWSKYPKHWWTSYDYFLDITGYHDNNKALQHPWYFYLLIEVDVFTILGEPGAASRDDAMFSAKVFFKSGKAKSAWPVGSPENMASYRLAVSGSPRMGLNLFMGKISNRDLCVLTKRYCNTD